MNQSESEAIQETAAQSLARQNSDNHPGAARLFFAAAESAAPAAPAGWDSIAPAPAAPEMTIKQAAAEALALQNGVNASGIAHSLARILSEAIWPEARRLNEGCRWVNQHPIVTVILDKLQDLNADSSRDIFAAHDVVKRMAE